VLPTDANRLADPIAAVAQLPRVWTRGAAAFAVIVREADASKRAELAAKLAPVCRVRHILLLIANDPALASRVRADGVHFSEAAIARRAIGAGAIRSVRKSGVVTAAAHSYPALLRANHRGVDAALLSPVFPTLSHPGARPIGALRFAAFVHGLRRRGGGIGVMALGGVTARNAERLVRAGATGLATIGALK
jgi:thiamine-phosphate pyrophosphorylase